MRCPRCGEESGNEWYCSRCGEQLCEPLRPIGGRAEIGAAPHKGLFWFVAAFLGIHVPAWLLLDSGASFWSGAGIACAGAFMIGLLAGALRVMNPMDADALGEPVILPSTLPGRYAPVLFLATFFGMLATPVVSLVCYLILAHAKACLDNRVLVIFGLTLLSSVILSSASSTHFSAAFGIYSSTMLPSMMVGWALSSFFPAAAW